jgi:23S rRNA (guanine2445-N2)-methyltransferase / 23S rRNA (guanine2069-N7)-methyltransferase
MQQLDQNAPSQDGQPRFVARCPKGFESLLAGELSSFGTPQVRPLRGQVSFGGTLTDAYGVCLWSRLASSVVLELGHVGAQSSDALYSGLYDIPWEDHVPMGATVAVDAHGTNDALRNSQFVALRAKDAIVDRLQGRRGVRPMVDTHSPDVRVSVRISRDRATVGIDLSGRPLFRRGYESARSQRSGVVPLRPDYAAALLEVGGWWRACRDDDPALASLYCGTGTILAEAAGQALNRAPGLLRTSWGFTGWGGHDGDAWNALLDDARERAEEGEAHGCTLVAYEHRGNVQAEARQTLRAAGIHVEPRFVDAPQVGACVGEASGRSLLVADLSWIEADEVATQASALSALSAAITGLPQGTQAVVLSPNAMTDRVMDGSPVEETPVLVGRDEASIRLYDLAEAPERTTVELPGRGSTPVLVPTSEQFARRLAKVAKLRAKWARREGIDCYRVYDADLPDYAVTIDLFQGSQIMPARGRRGRWLQVSEYAAPREIDPALARERLLDVLSIAPLALDVRPEDTFVHVRTRSKGGSQYAEAGRGLAERRRAARPGQVPLPPGSHLIDEGGLVFEVNFSSRLDCGIFLDHRETRAMVREMAKQTMGSKRFLNLFAYTGTATCYAADGGAKHTTTVDMSAPSLDWARRNMERNGFVGEDHEFVQADVLRWVSDQRRTKNRWDLVFCDVPTFSNSSRMSGSWDVQRDHAELLIGISRLLTRNGVAVFSCNRRDFKPDVDYLARYGVEIEDVTAQTIPEDFSRNPKVHHCYLVRRTQMPTRP